MVKNWSLCLLLMGLAFLLPACGDGGADSASTSTAHISGTIESGLRVLTIDPAAADQNFTIYRGDYVRVEPAGNAPGLTLRIADLQVDKTFPAEPGDKSYFKVPETGRFPFTTAGGGSGVIQAIELAAATYQEVTSAQAAELIATLKPVIVDVRTPREYQSGHLKGAQLIPVQEFQRRVGELAPHKNAPVFVYCRTGNRSTVAAKVLVDQGFSKVINLRYGIVEWQRTGHEIVH